MAHGPKQLVWLLAAWTVVATQIAPSALCRNCDRGCCATATLACGGTAIESLAEPAGGCPLCAARARASTVLEHQWPDAADQPCRCQLDARQDQPSAPPKSASPAGDHSAPVAISAITDWQVPQALGVSQEYLLASFAVPIRPPRILFGVWRN